MSSSFFDLIELAQLRAIESALNPSVDSVYRLKCREYSQIYNTPYHEVLKLDVLEVLTALYENQFQPNEIEGELEEILEKLYKIQDPTYNAISKEETEELVDAAINHELKRLGKKKEAEKKTPEREVKEPSKKSGGMTFTDLENSDRLIEGLKGGFKD